MFFFCSCRFASQKCQLDLTQFPNQPDQSISVGFWSMWWRSGRLIIMSLKVFSITILSWEWWGSMRVEDLSPLCCRCGWIYFGLHIVWCLKGSGVHLAWEAERQILVVLPCSQVVTRFIICCNVLFVKMPGFCTFPNFRKYNIVPSAQAMTMTKIPSEMEVAPRYNCWHCWHFWHCWHCWRCWHCWHCLTLFDTVDMTHNE